MEQVSLGLIGLGEIGKVHLYNCFHLKNAKLIAVADISQKSLLLAKRAGVKYVYRNYDDLLKRRDVDAVIISLPTFLHCECAERAAERGKNIFLEKPLATNIREGERILECVKQNGVVMMMGYPMRFDDSLCRLKSEIELGTLGDIQVATALYVSSGPFYDRIGRHGPSPVPDWWFDKKLVGGGVLLDLGCHMINLLRWYFGNVSGVKSYLGHRFNMDFEDYAICLLKFQKGIIATIKVGWFSQRPLVRIEMEGTSGHMLHNVMETPEANVLGVLNFAVNALKRKIYGKPILPIGYELYYEEVKHFVSCISSDTTPSITGEEGIEDLRVISAAYEHNFQIE